MTDALKYRIEEFYDVTSIDDFVSALLTGFLVEFGYSPGGGGHHYNGNAETYMDVGIAMGDGMVELLKAKE